MPRAVLDGASLTIHRCAAVLVFRYDAKRDQDHARAVAEMSYADMQCTMLNTPEPAVPVIKDAQHPFWQERDHTAAVRVCHQAARQLKPQPPHRRAYFSTPLHFHAQHAPAVHCVAGWYDLLLRETVADYERIVDAREQLSRRGELAPPAMLTIGPWYHFESLNLGPFSTLVSHGMDFFDEVMRGRSGLLRKNPVLLYIMDGHPSKGEWREFAQWPPNSTPHPLYLLSSRGLSGVVPKSPTVPPSSYVPVAAACDWPCA